MCVSGSETMERCIILVSVIKNVVQKTYPCQNTNSGPRALAGSILAVWHA